MTVGAQRDLFSTRSWQGTVQYHTQVALHGAAYAVSLYAFGGTRLCSAAISDYK